ncbi:MAG: AAA family ATPase [Novosphingobium sp.]|nr:AAA family ATPase [Novosphingobium sp.]
MSDPSEGWRAFIAPPADPDPHVKAAADQMEAARIRSENGTSTFSADFRTPEQKREDLKTLEKISEDTRRAEEARLEAAKLKSGVPIPRPMAPMDAIPMEVAMSNDTATVALQYLVDPFLPSRCVVGFFGRGSTAKSSLVATLGAQVSGEASTLWISVEEQNDWIRVRHMKAGGEEGTLFVVTAAPLKADAQGRTVGSSIDVYEHLEPAIQKAKLGADTMYIPPRPLKLVVLDTAVGLTGWRKGESPNDDASVKKLLAYLQGVAERYDVTIAIIGHSNKGKHEYFADTVAGASAWTNSPRLSFVHARDIREEHANVMRVAKSNLTTRFTTLYSTEPVHTLHKREEGANSVLVRVNIGVTVWGEDESMEVFEDATRKPQEDGEGGSGGGKKKTLVEDAVNALVQAVYQTGEPVTRDMVHQLLNREISRREWGKVDERLRLVAFNYGVVIETGAQNKVLYRKKDS